MRDLKVFYNLSSILDGNSRRAMRVIKGRHYLWKPYNHVSLAFSSVIFLSCVMKTLAEHLLFAFLLHWKKDSQKGEASGVKSWLKRAECYVSPNGEVLSKCSALIVHCCIGWSHAGKHNKKSNLMELLLANNQEITSICTVSSVITPISVAELHPESLGPPIPIF